MKDENREELQQQQKSYITQNLSSLTMYPCSQNSYIFTMLKRKYRGGNYNT